MYVIIGSDALEPSHYIRQKITAAIIEQEVYVIWHYDYIANLGSFIMLRNLLQNLLYHLPCIIQQHLAIVNISK